MNDEPYVDIQKHVFHRRLFLKNWIKCTKLKSVSSIDGRTQNLLCRRCCFFL